MTAENIVTVVCAAVAGLWIGVPFGWFLCSLFSVSKKYPADNGARELGQYRYAEVLPEEQPQA